LIRITKLANSIGEPFTLLGVAVELQLLLRDLDLPKSEEERKRSEGGRDDFHASAPMVSPRCQSTSGIAYLRDRLSVTITWRPQETNQNDYYN
jgi:hypothetical protein